MTPTPSFYRGLRNAIPISVLLWAVIIGAIHFM